MNREGLVRESAELKANPAAEQRARALVQRMTLDEKLKLVFGYFSTDFKGVARPREGVPQAAGFIQAK